MKLGFYYHTPLGESGGVLRVPGYIGVFLDALAQEVEELRLFLHAAQPTDTLDYALSAPNIRWVNLGPKTPAWHRSLRHRTFLKRVRQNAGGLDALLVRGPSPLAPYFAGRAGLGVPVSFLVVGDYGDGANYISQGGLRGHLVRAYTRWNDRTFKRALQGEAVIVNSRRLYETYAPIAGTLQEVKTTTLRAGDFFPRTDTCTSRPIRLLYTGRIVAEKGLAELVEATARLAGEGLDVQVEIVGWEDDPGQPVEQDLRRRAERLGIGGQLHFLGRKRLGDELNACYRAADVYVIPSYHEGFPRTIWEAMANGLPVVATAVGSIPSFLADGTQALLIPPQDVDALASALRRVLQEDELRRALIREGHALAKGVTLEAQTRVLVGLLQHSPRQAPTPSDLTSPTR